MTGSAIAMMLFGIAVLWGGTIICIRKKKKKRY